MVSKHAKLHALIGIGLIITSIVCAVVISPNIAPEFSGRAKLHLIFTEQQRYERVVAGVSDSKYEITTEKITETEYVLNARSLSGDEYTALKANITEKIGEFEVKEYQSFSPSISKELLYKAIIALVMAVIIIIIYISFVFKKASHPVASWKYGVAATMALLHDTIIPLGLFSIIAPFTGAMVDTLFVTALLATLGYSINDTIVVFDRMRDRLQTNKEKKQKEEFDTVVEYGVRSSLRRSIYTSTSTVVPLLLLFLLVSATKWFSIALFAGVAAGTYSITLFRAVTITAMASTVPAKKEKRKTIV